MTYRLTDDGTVKVYRSRTGSEVEALERPSAEFYEREAEKVTDAKAREWLAQAAQVKARLGKNADAESVAAEVAKERVKGNPKEVRRG